MTKYLAAVLLLQSSGHSFLGDFLRFEYVLNPYGFLSILAPLPSPIRSFLLSYGVLLLITAGLLYVSITNRLSTNQKSAAYFILAGGISNLLDRFLHDGNVIDFIQVGVQGVQTGIFNAADLYILFGSFYLGYSFAVHGTGLAQRVE